MMKNYKNIFHLLLLCTLLSIQTHANDLNFAQDKGISASFSKSTQSKKEALIIGVSDYKGERADLNGIELDVDKMKRLFKSWGFETKVLYNQESMQILEYLDNYGKHLDSDDFFAFYYTGHGSHKRDESGDEPDGEDETLVLSDGRINKHLIDDILYKKFNEIRAKKLIFFDSCHSGTVFRSLNGKAQAKTIKPEEVTDSFRLSSSKGLSVGGDQMSGDEEFIVFSSSRDTEESLATPTGSLFTNSLSEVFTDRNLQSKSLNEINKILIDKVLRYAKETNGKPHHPNISYSSNTIGAKPLKSFILKKSLPSTSSTTTLSATTQPSRANTVEETLESLFKSNKVDRMALSYSKKIYHSGESVKFTLDTQGNRGFLSIFYVDGNDVTILYPNPFVNTKEISGRYQFPEDLSNGKFELEAYKSCANCQEERTTIYALLTAQPISTIHDIQSKGLISFPKKSKKSNMLSRAVRIKATAKSSLEMKPQLGKYQFMVK
jgi:hypothetical protein